MKKAIRTLVGLVAIALVGGATFIYSGVYNVGADETHWSMTYRLMETVRVRSIKARAAGIAVAPNLDDQDRVLAGAVHFSTHCAICHSAPGVEAGDMAQGMYPKPPELAHVPGVWKPNELFWIVKHGIKMSGMPSWADHGDDQLWNSVAFMQKLPDLTSDGYKKLLQTAKAKGIGHEMSGMQMNEGGAQPAAKTTPPSKGTAPSPPGGSPH